MSLSRKHHDYVEISVCPLSGSVLSLLSINPNSNCVISGSNFVIIRFQDLSKPDPCSP